jgi:diacylglycerol kinase family enzyme
MPRVEVIVNSTSGSFVHGVSEETIAEAFRSAGLNAKISAVSGESLLDAARDSEADVLGAAGGDGTISAVASAAIERDKALAVLPLGTLNHFSKDIGIPQDIAAAARVVANGRVHKVDVGQVNDRIFLNNSSIGLYPHMVLRRKKQQETLGRSKWHAALSAALKVLRRHPFFRVEMRVDGRERVHESPFVFVGNNEYAMDLYNIGTRERLDTGKLSVYFVRRGGRWGLIRLAIHTLLGMLDQMEEFEQLTVAELSINMRQRHSPVACDGEVEVMDTPLRYRILRGRLKVIVPAKETK